MIKILTIIIVASINIYAISISDFNKKEKENIKSMIDTSKFNDRSNLKKLFKALKINEKIVDNMYVRMQLSPLLHLCKRDSKCKINKKKQQFKMMSNNLDRTHALKDSDIDMLFMAMDTLNNIINENQKPKIDPFILRKQQYEKEQLLAKEKKKVATLKRKKELELKQAKKQEARQKIINSLNKMAVKQGFKAYQSGLQDLLSRLKRGFTKVNYEKDYLWGLEPRDNFKVDSIVGEYIIYSFYNDHNMKVAFLKEKNTLYQNGSYMDTDINFSILGIKEFQTILGTTRQIIVLKKFNKISSGVDYKDR